jgi:hypothetical protein
MPRIRPPVLSTRALPATVTDLLKQRIVHVQPRLIDEIEKVLIELFDDPEFRALRGVDDPEETVEGSVQDDDSMAARMIREKGGEMKLALLKKSQLHDVRIKLRAAERRFNASRAQRARANVRAGDVSPAPAAAAVAAAE